MEKDFGAALQLFDKGKSNLGEGPRLSARATIHVLAGDAATAATESEEARTAIEARLQERPHDLDSMIQLSWVNLALNRQNEAVVSLRRPPVSNPWIVCTLPLPKLRVPMMMARP